MSEARGPVAGLARSAATRPFWDGLAAGELCLPRCDDCGQLFFYPRLMCPHCWSEEISWQRAGGGGTVYAVTTVHVAFDPSLDVPYAVAIVDLDEGVRMPVRLAPAAAAAAVGDRVRVALAADPALSLPTFEQAAAIDDAPPG